MKRRLCYRFNGTNLGKDSSNLPKEESIVTNHITHSSSDKNQIDGTLQSQDQEDSQKDIKHVFGQYSTDNMKHTCTICGQHFDYLHALAQHYPDSHKGYEAYQRLGV